MPSPMEDCDFSCKSEEESESSSDFDLNDSEDQEACEFDQWLMDFGKAEPKLGNSRSCIVLEDHNTVQYSVDWL